MGSWNEKSNQELLRLLGSSLKGRRLQKDISQEELSELSGVSKPSITRLETGKGNISLLNLLSILKSMEMADELKLIFKNPEASPSLLSKGRWKKMKERVGRPRGNDKETDQNWTWGEDKNE